MEDCIFCKIIAKQIESTLEHEDDSVVAFRDIRPKAPVHLLVVSKKHIDSLNMASAEDQLLLGHMLLVAQNVAVKNGIAESGYKVVTNIGEHGGQIIHHLHLHVVGGEKIEVSI